MAYSLRACDGTFMSSRPQINLLQALASQFFGGFILASSEIKQSLLKPSLLGPIPIVRRKLSVGCMVLYCSFLENHKTAATLLLKSPIFSYFLRQALGQIPATVRMRLTSGFIDHSLLEPVQFFELGAKECFACQERTVGEPDLVRLT